MGAKVTEKTKAIITLYQSTDHSTQNISDIFGMKKNSVISLLKSHNVLKLAPGRRTEKRVVKWLRKQGFDVEEMPGDAPFDILLNGDEKVDIKNSNSHINQGYYFELQHKQSELKNLHEKVDHFIFVFNGREMYTGRSKNFRAYQKKTRLKRTDNRIWFLGILESDN